MGAHPRHRGGAGLSSWGKGPPVPSGVLSLEPFRLYPNCPPRPTFQSGRGAFYASHTSPQYLVQSTPNPTSFDIVLPQIAVLLSSKDQCDACNLVRGGTISPISFPLIIALPYIFPWVVHCCGLSPIRGSMDASELFWSAPPSQRHRSPSFFKFRPFVR